MANTAPAAGRDPSAVAALITLVASTASALLAVVGVHAFHSIEDQPLLYGIFVAITLGLQFAAVEVYGRGTLSFASTGVLATAFSFGVGPAMLTGLAMAGVLLAVRRPKLHRAVFDAANFGLSAAAAAAIYQALAGPKPHELVALGASVLAATAYCAVNVGLLSVAMGLSEGLDVRAVWAERFRWRTPYYLASGPLAYALIYAYQKIGIVGLLAFTLPPAMMMVSVRQYVSRTRKSVDEVRQANEELRKANLELESRNEDLSELFEFAGGLAARAHDRDSLTGYAEEALEKLTGANAALHLGPGEFGIGLVAGGKRIASLVLEVTPGFEGERWDRLRDAILPQLATAIESAELVTEVRRKHLATIAALSRSMEAKDDYTGGHTERVSDVAVAIASRLGFSGGELDDIEVGALLHDIGKIGIPERILHKPGPLDDDEWKVMKEHPLISEHILLGIDLSPVVVQIARSSHERIDGAGYPDQLAGDQIPLPARIVLVADAWDALTSDRPYRRGRSIHAAMEEIRSHSGTQFCPKVVAALEQVYREEPHILGTALRAVEAGAA